MSNINLFGLSIEPTGDGSCRLLTGPFQLTDCSLTGDRLQAGIKIGTFSILLDGRAPFAYSDFTMFRISDKDTVDGLRSKATFYVRCGGLVLANATRPHALADSQESGFSLRDSFSFDFQHLPIDIEPTGSLSLDFSKSDDPVLRFGDLAFELEVRAKLPNRSGLFVTKYPSVKKEVHLHQSQACFDIPFQVSSKSPAALYCEPVDGDGFTAGMTADSCVFHVAWGERNQTTPQLVRVWLQPGASGLGLTTYALADSRNQPARWNLKGTHVDLNFRMASGPSPSTLVFAPLQPGPDQVSGAEAVHRLEVTQAGDLLPIHGPVANGEFFIGGASGALVCDLEEPCSQTNLISSSNDGESDSCIVSDKLVSKLTYPWLRFIPNNTNHPKFCYTKPGTSYVRASVAQKVETLSFEGSEIVFPILPMEWLNRGAQTCKSTLQDILNRQMAQDTYRPPVTIHETLFRESPVTPSQTVELKSLFAVDNASSKLTAQPSISNYPSNIDFGLAGLTVDLGSNPPPYVLLTQDKIKNLDLAFFHCLDDFSILPKPSKDPRWTGVLKLSRNISLEDILKNNAATLSLSEQVNDAEFLNVSLRDPTWTGLILFGLKVNCDEAKRTPELSKIVPSSGVNLDYLALSPKKGNGQSRPSISGRVNWKNASERSKEATNPEEHPEVRCVLTSLQAEWFDGAMTRFHTEVEIYFAGFFGQTNGKSALSVEGTFDSATKTIRLATAFPQPIQVIGTEPSTGKQGPIPAFGPLKSVDVRSATIETVDGKAAFSLDGSIRLQGFGDGNFDSTNNPLDFTGLRIFFEKQLDAAGSWLPISYPSFRFPVPVPVLKFLSFELKLDSLGLDWTENAEAWNSFLRLPGGSDRTTFPAVRLKLILDLMKLPLLAWKNVDRLSLQVLLVFDKEKVSVGIGFAGFDLKNGAIKLDLLRFLVLSVEEVKVDKAAGGSAQALILHKVTLEILEKPIFSNLEVVLFSGDKGRHGFLACKPPSSNPAEAQSPSNAKEVFLKIFWLLIAQDVKIKPSLLQTLQALPNIAANTQPADSAQKKSDDQSGNNNGSKGDSCPKKLTKADDSSFLAEINDFSKNVVSAATDTTFTDLDQWMFGVGFRLLSILDGKFLFQDGYYYGITLDSPMFCEWFGFDLALSVVYVKGSQPSEDEFSLSLRVPRITLPAFAFMGGIIALQLSVDGSFLLDVGFPTLQNGVRRWDRAIGAIVTPYQGSGGFYLRRQGVTGLFNNGEKKRCLIIGAGLALQFGLGGAYGGGFYRVTASIGIFVVIEGDAVFQENSLIGIILIGSIGLLGRASGELNWWVISIRIEVLLIAEARTEFYWGCNPRTLLANAQSQSSSQQICKSDPPTISFQMTVYASVSASACIGWGVFQICAGITVSISIPISPEIKLVL